MAKVSRDFNVNMNNPNGDQPENSGNGSSQQSVQQTPTSEPINMDIMTHDDVQSTPTSGSVSARDIAIEGAYALGRLVYNMTHGRGLYSDAEEEMNEAIGMSDAHMRDEMQLTILNGARENGISIDEARQALVEHAFGDAGDGGIFAEYGLLEGDEDMPMADRISATAQRYLGFDVIMDTEGRCIAPTFDTPAEGLSIEGTDQHMREAMQDRILEIALEDDISITEARQKLVEIAFGPNGDDGPFARLMTGESWMPIGKRVQDTAERYLGFDVQFRDGQYQVESPLVDNTEPTETEVPEGHTAGELAAESIQNTEQHMQNVSQSVLQAVGSEATEQHASAGPEEGQTGPEDLANAMNLLIYGHPENQPIRDYFQNRMFQMCSEEGISIEEAANRMVGICFGEHGDDGLFGQNGMLLGDESMDLASRVAITSQEYLGFGTNIGLDGNLHPLNVAARLNDQYNHLLEQYPAIAQAEAVLGSSVAAYFGLDPAVGYAAVTTMNQASQGFAQAAQSLQGSTLMGSAEILQTPPEQILAEEALQADSEAGLSINEILQGDPVHNPEMAQALIDYNENHKSDRPLHTPMANGIPAKVTEPESSNDRSKDTGIELE